MPLFFFHLRTPSCLEEDELGLELDDVETAYLDACRAFPPMATDLLDCGHEPLGCSFEITNGAGELLMEVPFSEAISAKRRRVANDRG